MNTIAQLARVAAQRMVKAAQPGESHHQPRFPENLSGVISQDHKADIPDLRLQEPYPNQAPPSDPFAAPPEVGTQIARPKLQHLFPPAPSVEDRATQMMGPTPFKKINK